MEIVIYLISGIILCAILLGLLLKLFMIAIKILSIPTYLGLIYLEDIFNVKQLRINKPPKNGKLRFLMNSLAGIITIIYIGSISRIIGSILHQESFSTKLISGEIIDLISSIIVVINLILIYIINYFSEEDVNDSFAKIDKIDFNPFIKLTK